jgi:hypothetical protein
MYDNPIILADLALILGPDDDAHFLGHAEERGQGDYYAVVHRRHGLWTHLYRIAHDLRPDRLIVHFEAAFPGDCPDACRSWLAERGRRLV